MRSWLFVPGDSARKLEKGLASGADALIVDLEDSVAIGAKEAARRVTADFLAAAAVLTAGGVALYNFNQTLAQLEAQAKKTDGPVKQIGGDLLYTTEQAKTAAGALPPVTGGLTFMGHALDETGTKVVGFGQKLSDARKELADLRKQDPGKFNDLVEAIKSGAGGQ